MYRTCFLYNTFTYSTLTIKVWFNNRSTENIIGYPIINRNILPIKSHNFLEMKANLSVLSNIYKKFYSLTKWLVELLKLQNKKQYKNKDWIFNKSLLSRLVNHLKIRKNTINNALTIFADCISYEKDTFIYKLMLENTEKNIIDTIALSNVSKPSAISQKKVNNLSKQNI